MSDEKIDLADLAGLAADRHPPIDAWELLALVRAVRAALVLYREANISMNKPGMVHDEMMALMMAREALAPFTDFSESPDSAESASGVRKVPNDVRDDAMASDKADFVAAVDVWSAARAWQAFRDFLNGVGERGDMSLWKARCEQHFTDGQLQIALGHFPLRVRDEFEKRMTAEAIAQYERLQDHD